MKNYFSSNLKYLRSTTGTTLEKLGEYCKKSKSAIHYWEKEEREPNAIDVYFIAKYFGVNIDDLVLKDLRLESTKKLSINEFIIEVNKLLDKTDMDDKKKNMIRAILDNIKE